MGVWVKINEECALFGMPTTRFMHLLRLVTQACRLRDTMSSDESPLNN